MATPHATDPERPPLSSLISPVIMGGAAFSHQINAHPETMPAARIIARAFELGIRTLDTSPYYHPSEEVLGRALADPAITTRYARSDYVLMTKVGRVSALAFDYSAAAVAASVERSLARLGTAYLDVVFCHDVEYVTDGEALAALAALLDLVAAGKVRYVGVSGYPVATLARVARAARERFGRPLDVVQNWGQMTLQNTRLRDEGLEALRDAGVGVVCSSSPLAIGLLRAEGVPVGALGDWHPAPGGLREKCAMAADWVKGRGDSLANVALRFAFTETARPRAGMPQMSVIIGPGSVFEVEDSAAAAMSIRKRAVGEGHGDLRDPPTLDEERSEQDRPHVEGVRQILGEWIDYGFPSPAKGWDIQTKKMIPEASEGKPIQ
ncbi:hypothetical protein MBLNU459_g0085t1 [Dothideomycetes sp. NU459]